MTPDELRRWLDTAGVTQGGLSRLVEVNVRTVRRWCSGHQPIPDALRSRLDRVTDDEIDDAMGGVG